MGRGSSQQGCIQQLDYESQEEGDIATATASGDQNGRRPAASVLTSEIC